MSQTPLLKDGKILCWVGPGEDCLAHFYEMAAVQLGQFDER